MLQKRNQNPREEEARLPGIHIHIWASRSLGC
jgi:hypothetical protein